ncbi:hypothetical protein Fcan01_11409 [Folsomia candida]|uniref:Uncharacterized protein n=1 Tax=Folsomia candida TaxID=158441 RepID=A0A226E978_FOLCA|nr:hypothetical protein Fcan01_11409 [Folsomia candida]
MSILLLCLQSRKELSCLSGFLVSTVSLGLTAVILLFTFRAENSENETEMGVILAVAGGTAILLEMLWTLIRGTRCSEEDYIFAAVLLYVVVIFIFLAILLLALLIVGTGNGCSNSSGGGAGSCRGHGGGIRFCPIFGRAGANDELLEASVVGEDGNP